MTQACSESDGVADSIDEIPSEDQVSAAEQTDDTPESKYTSYKIVGDNIDKKVNLDTCELIIKHRC